MTWSVYQHWDPLKVCVVGRSYPPEFYSWIKTPHVRSLFERIAVETEEDYQTIINKLNKFGVTVLRPDLPKNTFVNGKFLAPPMMPRDNMVMIGSTFYFNYKQYITPFNEFYSAVKDPSWPDCLTLNDFKKLPQNIQNECVDLHNMYKCTNWDDKTYVSCYNNILNQVSAEGNNIKYNVHNVVNGAMVSRLGKNLYFGTWSSEQDSATLKQIIDNEFNRTANYIFNSNGHTDGIYCPVCPGLLISTNYFADYSDSFPDWEIEVVKNRTIDGLSDFAKLKSKNNGKWWIPGFEDDQEVINVVETWLNHWTGCVEESVFDVNMLFIDPKNVMVIGYNEQVFKKLEQYGITAHIVPFRHCLFWDGGLHCNTADLDRTGTMQNFFVDENSQ